jgi:hypothetical protein
MQCAENVRRVKLSLPRGKYSPNLWSDWLLSQHSPGILAWLALQSHTFGEYLHREFRKSLGSNGLQRRSALHVPCFPPVLPLVFPRRLYLSNPHNAHNRPKNQTCSTLFGTRLAREPMMLEDPHELAHAVNEVGS